MQSSPPTSLGKARTMRELSRSLSHSPRAIPSPSPPPSDSNPTRRSGFGTETTDFFKDPDVLMSTQRGFQDDTNTLPRFPRIRSTAKKMNAWQGLRSEQPLPDTSMVNKEFADFDQSISDEESISIEHARGGNRSNRATPSKMSSAFNSLYDVTPPTNRTRKSYAAETGSLRRDAQIRRASRNDLDTASPRPAGKRNSPAMAANQDRKRNSLAQMHAKASEDESSFMEERPPTLTTNSTKNTRWGNRQTSLQTDGLVESNSRVHATPRSRPSTGQNATAQSFILPDLPNLTELVSGVFEDGTPVFSKSAAARSRFSAPPNGGRRPQHIPIEGVPIPEEEKAIFAALQLLQDKVAQMEHERAEQAMKIEEQDLQLIELKAAAQAQDKARRSDSALDSDSGKSHWKVEKTRLDASVQTLRTKLDRADRKVAVLEIEKKRLNTERDNMAGQLGIAFQTCEELKNEKITLANENDALRQELDAVRAENDDLHEQLQQEHSKHRDETMQLRQQLDQAGDATQKENLSLQAELARARAQHDDYTQQLARQDAELSKARQEKAEYSRVQAYNETLKSQLASLKMKRDEDAKQWARQETAMKSKVDRRDETTRYSQSVTQEQTNEAMRMDNENLRQELAQLAAQHDEENERWYRKEMQLKRKIQQREDAARKTLDMTHEVLQMREANNQPDMYQRKPSYGRESSRTRVKSRTQEPRKSQYTGREDTTRKSRSSLPNDTRRSVSAPMRADKNPYVESDDVQSTTDLSLAPRGTPYTSRNIGSARPTFTIQPPADMDLTELSFIDSNQIAQLRRALEEERAAARQRGHVPADQQVREDTVRSQRQTREDTARSVASARSERRPSLPRKSSLKDVTARTTDEDVTGEVSNLDADADTKQSADFSMHSNTSRRRRSAPTEMTSAFIVPDLKIESRRQSINGPKPTSKDHDNANCTVCRREGLTSATDALRVPKLVPASSRTPDDVDATLRPARSPKEALAFVVKELQDERTHLHMELAVMRAMLESHDASMGNRKRQEINSTIQDLLRRLEIKDAQIYNLYDVLEGQQDHDITEQDVEELTREIRAEDKSESEKKGKRVTIRSFVDEDDNSIEVGRGGADGETDELPWEGFEDADADFSAFAGWKTSVH